MKHTEKEDERLVLIGHRQFERLIDRTQGGGILIDREVMESWEYFASRSGWPAVERTSG